jgi:hypothetical protein
MDPDPPAAVRPAAQRKGVVDFGGGVVVDRKGRRVGLGKRRPRGGELLVPVGGWGVIREQFVGEAAEVVVVGRGTAPSSIRRRVGVVARSEAAASSACVSIRLRSGA